MRTLATILIISGLAALSWGATGQRDLIIAIPGVALATLWWLAIVFRWPRGLHTACLSATASLCALSVILKVPVLVPLFCLSASLYGWDLLLLELRLQSHPRDETFRLSRKYAIRCLGLGLTGTAITLIVRGIHVQLSFFAAFAISCLCLMLFLLILRHARRLLDKQPSGAKEKRTAKGRPLDEL